MPAARSSKSKSAKASSKSAKAGKETGMKLVIVESPTKANTIRKYLGPGYMVEASVGHVRDLVTRKTDLSAKDKRRQESWIKYGVNIENGFEPLEEIYRVPPNKKAQIDALKRSLKDADALYLATDDDREGEAISWHLVEELKPKVPVHRLVFREITERAIQSALSMPRDLDMRLVNAQRTRRVLDRLYGWDVSQVLWRKIKPGLSAGRVQSVALRLLVARERERIAFVQSEYWDLLAKLRKEGAEHPFDATLVRVNNVRIANGRDFDQTTGKLTNAKAMVLDGDAARALVARLADKPVVVKSREVKPVTQKPHAPYTTSTLQQDANRRLRFPAARTMRVAQSLYEKGFITYMRTDSTTLSQQALGAARSWIEEACGANYVPEQARLYATRDKNAQEAHEAIRPAGDRFTTPEDAKDRLSPDETRLYEMIWRRTIASQMKNAQLEQTVIEIGVDNATFRTSGRAVVFDGFLRVQPRSDSGAPQLPLLSEGEVLERDGEEALVPRGHHTRPPARLNDATLVRALEDKGIGRPSTYATIIQHLLDRGYCFRRANTLVPTFMGMIVVRMLEEHMPHLVDYNFTATMEARLDEIATGSAGYSSYLQRFYTDGFPQLDGDVKGLTSLLDEVRDSIDPADASGMSIGSHDDVDVMVRIGRYGTFLRFGESTASVPEDQAPDELSIEAALKLIEERRRAEMPIAQTEDGTDVFLKTGRFGPYLQLGTGKDDEKPKMVSVSKGMAPDSLTRDRAIAQLSLPRELGKHPDSDLMITAHVGRYGDYVKTDSQTATLPTGTFAIDVDLEGAIAALAKKKTRGREKLRVIGNREKDGVEIALWNGRWGHYVSDGETNKTLGDLDPETVTLEKAVELIKLAREAKIGRILGKDPSCDEDVRLLDGRFGPYLTNGKMNASLPRGMGKDEVDLRMALERLASHGKPVKKRAGRGRTTAKSRTTAKKKTTAKKTTAKKKTAKKTTAKKTTAKKTTAKKTTAKKAGTKAAAKKTTTMKATAAKKTTTRRKSPGTGSSAAT